MVILGHFGAKLGHFGNEFGAFCPDSWGTLMQIRAFLPRFMGHLVQNLGHFARAGGAMAPLAPPLDQPLISCGRDVPDVWFYSFDLVKELNPWRRVFFGDCVSDHPKQERTCGRTLIAATFDRVIITQFVPDGNVRWHKKNISTCLTCLVIPVGTKHLWNISLHLIHHLLQEWYSFKKNFF